MPQPERVGVLVGNLTEHGACTRVLASGMACGEPGERTRLTGFVRGATPTYTEPRCPTCTRAEIAVIPPEPLLTVSTKPRPALEVPELYTGVTFDSLEAHGTPENAKRLAFNVAIGRRYVDQFATRNANPQFPHVLIVRGGHGTGKGHWLWALARAVNETHVASVVVETVAMMVKKLRASWRDASEPSELSRIRGYVGCDLLILNELSTHALHGEPTQHLFDIIDPRQEWRRPTIIVSNEKDDGELSRLLGPAITSRALAWSGVLEFGDVDYRRTVLAQRRKEQRTP